MARVPALSVPTFPSLRPRVPAGLPNALIWTATLTLAAAGVALGLRLITGMPDGHLSGGLPARVAPRPRPVAPASGNGSGHSRGLAAGSQAHNLQGAGVAPAPSARAKAPAKAKAPAPAKPSHLVLTREHVLGLFSIAAPPSWERALSGGAVLYLAPGSRAEVKVFYSDHPPPKNLADSVGAYLSELLPGAHVSLPRAISLGGIPATQVRARRGADVATGIVFAHRGRTFFGLARTAAGAPRSQARRALAMLHSVRPE